MLTNLLRHDLIPHCRDGKGEKCKRLGPLRLVAPDGAVVPGFMCHQHAVEAAREYVQKLNEHWSIVDGRTGEVA